MGYFYITFMVLLPICDFNYLCLLWYYCIYNLKKSTKWYITVNLLRFLSYLAVSHLIRSSDETSKRSPSMFQGYVPSEEMIGIVFESHSSFSSETSSAQLPWERGRSLTAFTVCVSIKEKPNCRRIKKHIYIYIYISELLCLSFYYMFCNVQLFALFMWIWLIWGCSLM